MDCYNLLSNNINDLNYFKSLGWTNSQIRNQLSKKINYGLGLYEKKILKAFILGNLIFIENILEYEILLIYVDSSKRRLGYASKLLRKISLNLKKNNLKKIYLEVADNNLEAIKLYKKNGYKKNGVRKNYYNFNDKKINASLLVKLYD